MRRFYAKEEIYSLGRHVLCISRDVGGRIESVKKESSAAKTSKVQRVRKRRKRQSSINNNLANNNNPIAYDIIAVSC
jgi:hypothetical protein